MNTAGEVFTFFPENAEVASDSLVFQHTTPVATIKSVLQFHPESPEFVMVSLELTTTANGYFSLASPTLYDLQQEDISWAWCRDWRREI